MNANEHHEVAGAPPELSVALKEWASVCAALASGRQIVLLRKGGILESIGGFEVEHRRFALFPTYLHQSAAMLKPEVHAALSPVSAEPESVRLSEYAEVTDVIRIASRAQVDAIDAEHVWTAPLIDVRFNYRPKNPLYLLIVRAHRLAEPMAVANTPEYAGCKSWVELTERVPIAGAVPALDDEAFAARAAAIRAKVAGAAP